MLEKTFKNHSSFFQDSNLCMGFAEILFSIQGSLPIQLISRLVVAKDKEALSMPKANNKHGKIPVFCFIFFLTKSHTKKKGKYFEAEHCGVVLQIVFS